MPTEYAVTGPDIERDGRKTTPMAPFYQCENCGYVGAPFGIKRGDEVLSYCGWDGRQPACVGKSRVV